MRTPMPFVLPLVVMLYAATETYAVAARPAFGALAVLAAGIALGVAVSGHGCLLAVAGGALGALAAELVGASSPPLAWGLLLGLAHGERTLRVRDPRQRSLHLALAAATGAAAGALVASASAHLASFEGIVAAAMAAALVTLPRLVPADDALAHRLDELATALPESVANALREAADLRRAAVEHAPAPVVAQEVRRTFDALLRLAEARFDLEHTLRLPRRAGAVPEDEVAKLLDRRIDEHGAALRKALGAAEAAKAANVGLDDGALRAVEHQGERHAEASRAALAVEASLEDDTKPA